MKSIRNIFLGAVALVLTGVVSQASEGLFYFSGTGHWYEAVKVPSGLNWNQAYTNAISRNGYLCTITNA
ncbi:MAG: hypothetical protein M3Y82_14355, partial [Verrucomicrobiota bacterium]|nr:hypothetical protein [Verrucomicrobiota bacterium]